MARNSTAAPVEPVCPECGTRMVRIVYGFPLGDLVDRSMRGEIALGGCVVSGYDATHVCDHGHRWRWAGTSTQLDPDAAAGTLVPGAPRPEEKTTTSGWIPMVDPWEEMFASLDDDEDDEVDEPGSPTD
jgi:hypothetical protein